MLFRFSGFRCLLAAAMLAAPVVFTGCSGQVGVGVGFRTYDPYYRDYHVWNPSEQTYYNRWAVETHHDPHRDFRKMKKGDQQAYWKWRHDHH